MYNVLVATANPNDSSLFSSPTFPAEFSMKHCYSLSNQDSLCHAIRAKTADIIILDTSIYESLLNDLFPYHNNTPCILLTDAKEYVCPQETGPFQIIGCLPRPIDMTVLAGTLRTAAEQLNCNHVVKPVSAIRAHCFSERILYRWVLGSISDSDLEDYFDASVISLCPDGYTVSLIPTFYKYRCLSLAQKAELLKTCIDMLPGDWAIPPFFDLDENIVFISPQDLFDGFLLVLESILQGVAPLLGKQVYAAVGIQGISYTQVSKSYEAAQKVLARYRSSPTDKILFYSHGTADFLLPAGDSCAVLCSSQSFQNLLFNHQYQQCVDYLDELFSPDAFAAGCTPAFLRSQAIELTVHIVNALRSHNLDTFSIIGNDSGVFYKILSFSSIQDLYACMQQFLSAAIKALESVDTHYSPCVARTVAYIKANYMQELSLKTVANCFRINSAYLGQLFKSETSQSFSVFLNGIRIENAKKLLLETKLTLNVISQRCGYPNTSYFYNIFKKNVGQTPSQYRRSTSAK